ncbi:hypothetical protein SAMN05421505_120104 [Sinosporangium album]|uniref:Uncharacterized protein n=1 Tax=Sinosporangium album TaxID=504805 RepID=A0A1G8EHM6_9ACTN|nr:hypothetical protein [Sinosporangium album]SDH69342.1 hypothetical protein SAMN05421505_120104 [Sinosporangium album]
MSRARRKQRRPPKGVPRAMHPRWSDASRCPRTGKVRHSSRQEARAWAKVLHPENVSAFLCDACGYWHLGHLHWSGSRAPRALCAVDDAIVYTEQRIADRHATALGPSGVVARCGDHWHVTLLPAV